MRCHVLRPAAFAGLAVLLAACAGAPAPSGFNGGACLARLDTRAVAYSPTEIADPSDPRCHIDTAVRVTRIEAALDKPATMSCALASRLDEFDREVIQPLAISEFGEPAARIDHFGSYSCRGQNSSLRGRLSQHALGQAIDIAGLRLTDGSSISVERDWADQGPKQNFLHQVAREACRYFSVVLTPDSNADHYNHMHLDIGPDRLCSVS